jgi:pyruvate,water dikinase
MEDVKWFADVGKDDVSIVGGKGASLGEMSKAGIPVPPGFVVTAQAYQEFVSQVQSELMSKLAGLDVEDSEKLDKIAVECQQIILGCNLDNEVKHAISDSYVELGKGYVAVRSSATAEDLPEASFAGQQSTFLNVKGKKDVLQAVVECFASLFTARAIYYREKNNFKHDEVLIAVVVQKMVESAKAGVLFTVNPVTKDRKEMVIEGSFGLGELVVAGQITPDTYLVSREGEVKDITIGSKKKGLFLENGKNVEKELENSDEQVLNEEELKVISEMGVAIEKHYGSPQDIEWCIEDNELFIVQSRPITTL